MAFGDDQMICEFCGREINNNSEYCDGCGAPVSSNSYVEQHQHDYIGEVRVSKIGRQKLKKFLTALFGVVFALLGFLFIITPYDEPDVQETMIITGLVLMCGGIAMIIWAHNRKKLINDCFTYVKILSQDYTGDLKRVAKETNQSVETVKKRIYKMIEFGMLPNIYIDESKNQIVTQI